MTPELLQTTLEHATEQGGLLADAERDVKAAEEEIMRLKGELAMATDAHGIEVAVRRSLEVSLQLARVAMAEQDAKLERLERAKTKAKPVKKRK